MGLGLGLQAPASAATAGTAAASGAAAASRAAAAPGPGPAGLAQPVDVVILADESGSMRDDANEFVGMQQAATQIVDAEWSSQSRIAIYGFGSAPPGKPASYAIDQWCPLTTLSSQDARDTLTRCAAEINPRTAGDNTDFAQALQQAYETLAGSQAAGHLPLVFFMSDGALDEGPDSSYAHGASDPHGYIGDAAAQALITAPSAGWLARLRGIGAEVWPVRFGDAPKGQDTPDGQTELALFAAGGAQNGCPAGDGANPRVTRISPTATGTQETRDFQTALIAAFAEARCAVAEPPVSSPLPSGASVSRAVTISELATSAAIIVDKGSPQVTVTFKDPTGTTYSDASGGEGASAVGGVLYQAQRSGQKDQLGLETLQLTDPASGTWTVTFTNPAGDGTQQVGLSVVWQGQLGLEFTDQQVGEPGQPYALVVQPVAQSARVPASQLTGFTGQFQLTWPGGQVKTVAARLDTSTGRPTSGDFTALVTVPAADPNGTTYVTFTGAASGVQGLVKGFFPVRPDGALIVTLDNTSGTVVHPGETLTIHGTVTNPQQGTKIVFRLADLAADVYATLKSPAGAVPIPSGRTRIALQVQFDPQAQPGRATGTIQWAPALSGSGSPALSEYISPASLDVIIASPPTPLTSHWWLWLAVGLVLALIAAALGWWQLDQRRTRQAREKYLGGLTIPEGSVFDEPGGPPGKSPFDNDEP